MQKQRLLKILGTRIVELRKAKGLTQKDLAWSCGKDAQSLERVENGKSNPTVYYLHEIAEGLEIPLNKLIDF